MKLNQHLVLVRVDKPVEQDAKGIFIQEEWKRVPQTGVVEAVANDVTFCKKGDKVEFERYSAIEFSTDPDLRLCRDDAILAVL